MSDTRIEKNVDNVIERKIGDKLDFQVKMELSSAISRLNVIKRKMSDNLDFDVTMEADDPSLDDTGKTLVTASYGNVTGNVDYPYPGNKPSEENVVDVYLPISGKITFEEDAEVDESKWDNFDKKPQAFLTLLAMQHKIEYCNLSKIHFTKSPNNRIVEFSFDEYWGEPQMPNPLL